jgi:lipopolysaccharide transport system ATP-binding protein
MSNVVIQVENLGKQYTLGAKSGSYKTLQESLVSTARRTARSVMRIVKTTPIPEGRKRRPQFWALDRVNFEVCQGDVLGIVGRNGAGKSTLLKVLSQITEPTRGRVTVTGRVASLLEVGTGFHPELTGSENIFLNGAILGMPKTEIARKFDEIVAFAEVEKFIDTPVKYYSSGMYLRLAFSVAAHLEPEILVVDEVLAVGDAAFQKKCLGKMEAVAGQGRTVLFVSHNMGAIRSLCTRALWMDAGTVAADGSANATVSEYMSSVSQRGVISLQDGQGGSPLQLTKVALLDTKGESSIEFAPGESLTIAIEYFAEHTIRNPQFWIAIESQYGPLLGASMLFDGRGPEFIQGQGSLRCVFHSLPLVPQSYTIRMGARSEDGVTVLTPTAEAGFFHVAGSMQTYGFTGALADVLVADSTPLIIPYSWVLPDGRVESVKGLDAQH